MILTGRTREHLSSFDGRHFLHPQALEAFKQLHSAGLAEGFDISLISSFRDYERQEAIWNKKVLNSEKDARESILSILRWSALPGASRHHWGTDIDIFDGNKMTKEKVQLEPHEYDKSGPFHEMNQWLSHLLDQNNCFGFYRPYSTDLGGVSPEPWHLSFASVAQYYFEQYSLDIFLENIERSQMQLKTNVMEMAEEIYHDFFRRITLP